MLQGCGKATAHHVAQHVEDHDVGFFEQMVLLEQFDGLPDDIAAAAGAGRGSARLDAHHAIITLEHIVFGAKLFGMEFDRLKHVDDGRHQFLGQRERAVMLGIATDLQHALAE